MRIKEKAEQLYETWSISRMIGSRENRVLMMVGDANGGGESRIEFNDPHERPSRVSAFIRACTESVAVKMYVFDKSGDEINGMEFAPRKS